MTDTPTPAEREERQPYAHELADKIAAKIYPHNNDCLTRNGLANLLKQFADEIQRSAIEP